MSGPPIQSRSRGVVPLVALLLVGYMLWTQVDRFLASQACRDTDGGAACAPGPAAWTIVLTALVGVAIIALIVRSWLVARR